MKHLIFSFYFFYTLTAHAQNIEWQRSFGGSDKEIAMSVKQTTDGGYVVVGETASNNGDISGNHGNNDFLVMRFDAIGNILWQKCFGGSGSERAYEIQQTVDGGFVIVGFTSSNDGDVTGFQGFTDCWIVKLDSIGNMMWQKCLGGSSNDFAFSIQQTFDGGYVVSGATHSNDGDVSGNHGNDDYWIVKLDNTGNIQWQKCLGGTSSDLGAYSIQQSIDGGYIVAGLTASNDGDVTGNHGEFDYWVIKLDGVGNIQWQKCIGGTDDDYGFSLDLTYDGGVIVGGSTLSFDGDVSGYHGAWDYWVVKLDGAGNIQWEKCLGGTNLENANFVQQTTDGGYMVAGTASSNDLDVSGNHGGLESWIVKLDGTGNIQWQKCLGGTEVDVARCIQQTTDDGWIVAGYSKSNNGDLTSNHGNEDVWLVKLTDHSNFVTGKLYYDGNSNNVQDVGEPAIDNIKVNEVNTGRIGFSNSNGFYDVVVLDSGNYTVVADPLNYYAATPFSHNVYFNSIQQTDSLNDFAFQPSGVINDLCVSITPSGPFRMGFDANYVINFNNVGTTTLNNCNIIFFPDSHVTFVNSSAAPLSVTPDSIIWNIGTLTPFQTGSITVTVNVNLGTPIGTLINSGVRIEPVAGDANPSCNTNYFEVITTGSYDPNDILVNRATLLSTEFPNPPFLEYIIRFQNTGNDTAFTVKVMNNLNDKLDLNSFEWVASSHPMHITYEAHARLFTFTFNNILLPDSIVNEPESHGFIRYRIKPVSTLTEGDTINNSAAIYFDFNAPVITNTVITAVVLPTGIIPIADGESELKLFPNPATNELTVSVNLPADKISVLKVFDVLGQKVYEKEIRSDMQHHQFTINIDHLPGGMYILHFESGNMKQQSKFVKL